MGIERKPPEAGETEEEKIRIAFNMENDSVIEGISRKVLWRENTLFVQIRLHYGRSLLGNALRH